MRRCVKVYRICIVYNINKRGGEQLAGQIKKVRVHMTPNTSKNFTAVMLELYDKYKDTDFFDKMNRGQEINRTAEKNN